MEKKKKGKLFILMKLIVYILIVKLSTKFKFALFCIYFIFLYTLGSNSFIIIPKKC